jgi:hypothetical protein
MIPFLVLRLKLLWANWELDLGRRSGTRLSFLGGIILLIWTAFTCLFRLVSWFVHRLVRWNIYIPLNVTIGWVNWHLCLEIVQFVLTIPFLFVCKECSNVTLHAEEGPKLCTKSNFMIPFLVLRLKLLWANWELDLGRRSGTRLSFLGGIILLICSLYMSFQTCFLVCS